MMSILQSSVQHCVSPLLNKIDVAIVCIVFVLNVYNAIQNI